MQKFQRIIQSNITIAILITVLAYLLYPSISQYKWDIKNIKDNGLSLDIITNIDNDGENEYLKISNNNHTFGSLSLYTKDQLLLDLYNLEYNIFLGGNRNVVLEKLDQNVFDDIVLLGEKNDSLFLLVFEYKKGKMVHPSMRTFFLDHIKAFQNGYDFTAKIEVKDINSDGLKEIIVMVSSGYTVLPRRMYIVSVDENTVKRSPVNGAGLTDFQIVDVDLDGLSEIILNNTAFCNIYKDLFDSDRLDSNSLHDSIMYSRKDALQKVNDCKAWLIVLDHNLNYIFTPKSVDGWTGSLYTRSFEYNGENSLLSIYSNYKDSTKHPKILIHDLKGNLLLEKEIVVDNKLIMPLKVLNSSTIHNNYIRFSDANHQAFEINRELEIRELDGISPKDRNSNFVTSELINCKLNIEFSNDYLTIYNEAFDELSKAFFPGLRPAYMYVSIEPITKEKDLLLVDMGTVKTQITIEHNPYYFYRYIIWIFVGVFVWLMLELVKKIFSYRAIQEKRRFERIVEERTEEVLKQKNDLKKLTVDLRDKNEMVFQQNQELKKRREEIESLYEKLTSSITYGKGIKDALLPSEDEFKSIFPTSFCFFRPHNVLGGDFYWIHEQDNYKLLIIGDASGQGVSGAFLSFLAISILNDIRIEAFKKPSEILSSVNKMIHNHLSNYLKNSKEGIEMAVVIFEQLEKQVKVHFSSANIPLYYFENGSILDIKKLEPNDFCIRADVGSVSFKNQSITVPKQSVFYIATKGLSLQKSAKNQEIFGKVQLKSNLMRIHVLPIEEQKRILIEKFDYWQGANEQTDDVLCIGVRV